VSSDGDRTNHCDDHFSLPQAAAPQAQAWLALRFGN
jgi:hypothetical protein